MDDGWPGRLKHYVQPIQARQLDSYSSHVSVFYLKSVPVKAHIAMTSSCRHCRAIPMSLFFEPPHSDPRTFVLHHNSFKSLESSAAAGCNVCSLLYSTMAPAQLGPRHPCFEAGYDQVLFPLRRATTFANDQRVYLHMKSYRYKHSGISPNYLVCRVGASGGDQGVHALDMEYSGTVLLNLICPVNYSKEI